MIVLWIALVIAGAVLFAAFVGGLLRAARAVPDMEVELDEHDVERLTHPNGNVTRLPAKEDEWGNSHQPQEPS